MSSLPIYKACVWRRRLDVDGGRGVTFGPARVTLGVKCNRDMTDTVVKVVSESGCKTVRKEVAFTDPINLKRGWNRQISQ